MKRRAAGMARAEVVRLDRALGIGRDDLADFVERLVRDRLVHQAAERLADQPPARPRGC